MSPGQERLLENQKCFRRANDRLRDHVSGLVQVDQRVPFICECASESCAEPVSLTLDDYSRARNENARFLIVPGHRTVDGEDVVEDTGPYASVEKPPG